MFKKGGWSLVELLFVIALIGVLGGAAVILTPPSGPAQLDAAAKQVQSNVEYAQQYAMMSGAVCGVDFVGGGAYTVYKGDVTTPLQDPLTKLRLTVLLSDKYPGVSIQNNYTVEFDEFGKPTLGGGGSVTLGNGSSTRTIMVVDNTGNVVIQ